MSWKIRERGLRLGKVPFTDIQWAGELIRDLNVLKHSKQRLTCEIEKRQRELERYETNFEAEKKYMVDNILSRENRLVELDNRIALSEKEIAKLQKKHKPLPPPVEEPKKEDVLKLVTNNIAEHQISTISEIKEFVNGEHAKIQEGKVQCPECIANGIPPDEAWFTKGGAFIAHYKVHFKENGG